MIDTGICTSRPKRKTTEEADSKFGVKHDKYQKAVQASDPLPGGSNWQFGSVRRDRAFWVRAVSLLGFRPNV